MNTNYYLSRFVVRHLWLKFVGYLQQSKTAYFLVIADGSTTPDGFLLEGRVLLQSVIQKVRSLGDIEKGLNIRYVAVHYDEIN